MGKKSGSFFDMQFITSSISTMLVLLLLGMVVFFVLSANNLSKYVRENISFSVLISDDMKEAAALKFLYIEGAGVERAERSDGYRPG